MVIGYGLYTYAQMDVSSNGSLTIASNANPANTGSNSNIIFKLGTSGGGGPDEAGRFTSVGGFNVGNTLSAFGVGVFVGANGSRLQGFQNVNVAQNTATNITPSGALAGDGCYLVQVTARGNSNSNNNRTKLFLMLFRAVSFSGSSSTQIAEVFPDTGTGGEVTTLTVTQTFYSNADPAITVTAATRSGSGTISVYVTIMGC
jgi:hypothetical protein